MALVLVMACANLASFLLAQALDRRKEIAVRLALGARRRTIATLFPAWTASRIDPANIVKAE